MRAGNLPAGSAGTYAGASGETLFDHPQTVHYAGAAVQAL